MQPRVASDLQIAPDMTLLKKVIDHPDRKGFDADLHIIQSHPWQNYF
jgi:hypothetical protein